MTENKYPIKTVRCISSIRSAMFLRGIDTYGLIKQGRCLACSSNITLDQFQTNIEIEKFRKTGLCVKCIGELSQIIEGGR